MKQEDLRMEARRSRDAGKKSGDAGASNCDSNIERELLHTAVGKTKVRKGAAFRTECQLS